MKFQMKFYIEKNLHPKTYDPIYLNLVESRMSQILKDKNSKLNELINVDFVKNMIFTHGNSIKQNWFGQLMTYPQTLAYLIQVNTWLNTYNIKIEL